MPPRPRDPRVAGKAPMKRACAGLLLLLLGGCANLGYYGQSVRGQLYLWWRAAPVEQVLADPEVSAPLRARLQSSQAIRDFAVSHLDLPDNRSYRRYADLQRPFAVWNVIATPPDSLTPHPFCPPLVGCLPYQGFFSEAEALRRADALRAEGLETITYGVAAYSTLGWFADPLLNTFMGLPEPELAGLIFHELTHQQVFVKDDVAFNESLASFVEAQGIREWLGTRPEELAAWQTRRARGDRLRGLVLAARDELAALYAAHPADWAARKAMRLARLREDLAALWREAGAEPRGLWFDTPLGNPQLTLVATYHAWEPAWQRLFVASKQDWPAFWQAVREIAQRSSAGREACLRGESC
ncbi:MAG: aminopeptidase [Candidatus Dactylopiibacterium carminicum]|uniref:Aminopeptidase n=1 Tax=Candidatus Dactylopiibacterium carminicum TaxID=857335 RepID=A0A272EQL1_9RHOO|nr:aminopeptidase [Candidatus Dactylopiibacterium carminicum]KAF7599145.1 aminopeptidase [Candidatus Dactylopiibacterium carminicum]PAS92000.1 MAG: aminopeptidase [Candidatus Dactylopiibacterium carminicum]PAS95268.1 MAG: aminopeptidase [Candidatus Dactylopiibacterium carminicum]PAS99163.1 MAG: hypothetical protein BSR46_09660 [Candidatus Dactylopiibacterium carminicum]